MCSVASDSPGVLGMGWRYDNRNLAVVGPRRHNAFLHLGRASARVTACVQSTTHLLQRYRFRRRHGGPGDRVRGSRRGFLFSHGSWLVLSGRSRFCLLGIRGEAYENPLTHAIA